MSQRSEPIRTILAAPRSAARDALRTWLRGERDIQIVGEAPNGLAAIRLIERTAPDLAFIHVQLPRRDAFEVLEALGESGRPQAVILLDHGPQAAVRAFQTRATDFLLVPLEVSRLRSSLEHVRHRRWVALNRRRAEVLAADRHRDRIALRTQGRLLIVDLDRLLWIRASAHGTEVHLREGVIHTNVPLGRLDRQLPHDVFLRINRSEIVQQSFIQEIRPKSHGDRWVLLANGERTVLTRSRRQGVLRRL